VIQIAHTMDSIQIDRVEITAMGRVCVRFRPFYLLTQTSPRILI